MKNLTLSPSQINTFLRCQLQWKFRYIDEIKVPPKPSMVVGTSFHKTMEKNFKHKIEKKEDLPLDLVEDIYNQEFEKGIEEVDEKPDEKELGKIKDTGYKVTKKYRTEVAPKIFPEKVEAHSIKEIEKGLSIQGYSDLIVKNTVIDFKVVNQKSTKITTDYQLQLEAYKFLFEEIKKAQIHKAVQTKTPQILILNVNLPKSNERIINLSKKIAKVIKQGEFLPSGLGHTWACDYCGYKRLGLCKYNKG